MPAPSAPVLTLADTRDDGFTLTWTIPATGGSPITGYQIDIDGVQRFTQTATTLILAGIPGGTTMSFRVRAVNAIGASANSNTRTGTTTGGLGGEGLDGLITAVSWGARSRAQGASGPGGLWAPYVIREDGTVFTTTVPTLYGADNNVGQLDHPPDTAPGDLLFLVAEDRGGPPDIVAKTEDGFKVGAAGSGWLAGTGAAISPVLATTGINCWFRKADGTAKDRLYMHLLGPTPTSGHPAGSAGSPQDGEMHFSMVRMSGANFNGVVKLSSGVLDPSLASLGPADLTVPADNTLIVTIGAAQVPSTSNTGGVTDSTASGTRYYKAVPVYAATYQVTGDPTIYHVEGPPSAEMQAIWPAAASTSANTTAGTTPTGGPIMNRVGRVFRSQVPAVDVMHAGQVIAYRIYRSTGALGNLPGKITDGIATTDGRHYDQFTNKGTLIGESPVFHDPTQYAAMIEPKGFKNAWLDNPDTHPADGAPFYLTAGLSYRQIAAAGSVPMPRWRRGIGNSAGEVLNAYLVLGGILPIVVPGRTITLGHRVIPTTRHRVG